MSLVVEVMHELGITRISRWVFNCYVIHNNGQPVIVDAGLPSIAADVAPTLALLGGRVRAIVATHGHSDHVGGVAELAARYQAPIHLPATTMKYLDGEHPRTPTAGRAARIWPTLIDQPLDRIGCRAWSRAPTRPVTERRPVCVGKVSHPTMPSAMAPRCPGLPSGRSWPHPVTPTTAWPSGTR